MKTAIKLLVALTFTALLAMPAGAICQEYQDIWCDYQCYYYNSTWGWFCAEPADRCCWESVTGDACGDASSCEECDCWGEGGF